MRNKSLILVVALLAIASLMAAMAYTTASVENNMFTAVVKSDEALLALQENTEMTDFAKINTNGVMVFDFTKGYAGADSGVQPNAQYFFNDVFYVYNNTNHTIKFRVHFDSLGYPPGLYKINVAGTNLYNCNGTPESNANNYYTLLAGEKVGIDFKFNTNDDPLAADKKTHLFIYAERI
ncbi:MAG: DUF1102 domain-containing protein [Desulfitobacteriia bacterium]|jgi:hypothetical protein